MLCHRHAVALITITLSAFDGACHVVSAQELQRVDELPNQGSSESSEFLAEKGMSYTPSETPVSKTTKKTDQSNKLAETAQLGPFGFKWRTLAAAGVAAFGITIAAAGGIGGGGILVPILILVLELSPKHAIALSNLTILGGAIANTILNSRKQHPTLDRTLIDWDIIVMMEPLTIFGAVFGSLLSKVLPSFVLTVMLVLVLACIGYRTLKKGVSTWKKETVYLSEASNADSKPRRKPSKNGTSNSVKPSTVDDGSSNKHVEDSDTESECSYQALGTPETDEIPHMWWKIFLLTLCFAGTCALTVLKGGGRFASPLGVVCGSLNFWLLYFSSLPWVFAFVAYFRRELVAEYRQKVESGHTFVSGEVKWDSQNSLKFPIVCAAAGLMAGLFGVGGGIVKGPLMLEMGVPPAVSSATAAAMILYTSAAACLSYAVFGMLDMTYGPLFFILGLIFTGLGQTCVGRWVKKSERQSPIIFSIGTVLVLSSLLVSVNGAVRVLSQPVSELFAASGVCNASVN